MTNAELRRLAENATPGPWRYKPEFGVVASNRRISTTIDGPDCAFIAAASPDVVIALLDRCKALEKERDEYHGDFVVALRERNEAREQSETNARRCLEAMQAIADVTAERDARPEISREDARAWAYTYELDAAHVVYTALRAHAAKGGE